MKVTNPMMFNGEACFIKRVLDAENLPTGGRTHAWAYGPCEPPKP